MVKTVAVQWQCKSQFVVCALGAVWRVTFVGRIVLYLSKCTVKQQLKLRVIFF